MFRLDAARPTEFCEKLGRRDFLHTGLGITGFLGTKASGAVIDKDINCIMLFLVGGPSHLDTWDMKPGAPSEIRGPYKPIRTNVSGIEISENFPRMAMQADQYAILRGCYHNAPAVHDAGHQVMQTGRIFEADIEHPHIGCVVSKVMGRKGGVPAHVLLPGPIGDTGGDMPHGQSAGFLGKRFDPSVAPPTDGPGHWREAFAIHKESAATRERYGRSRFGQNCLLARRMIEAGVRFVTVNMFDTVFQQITWDIHGYKPFSPMNSYRDHVGPMFDMAYSSLLADLHDRGLLSKTMVVAAGEFGRTPRINPAGGRDHWPHCFSTLMAGGGVQGGQVVGSSDAIGGSPKDRPVSPGEIAATIYHSLGIPLDLELKDANGRAVPIVDRGMTPIRELFV